MDKKSFISAKKLVLLCLLASVIVFIIACGQIPKDEDEDKNETSTMPSLNKTQCYTLTGDVGTFRIHYYELAGVKFCPVDGKNYAVILRNSVKEELTDCILKTAELDSNNNATNPIDYALFGIKHNNTARELPIRNIGKHRTLHPGEYAYGIKELDIDDRFVTNKSVVINIECKEATGHTLYTDIDSNLKYSNMLLTYKPTAHQALTFNINSKVP